jgi:hypothetical protein
VSAAETGISSIPADAPRGYYGPDGQPQFFADPAMDRFSAVLVKLVQEVWVLTERVDAIERVAAAKGSVTAAEIAALLSDPAVSSAREAAFAQFISRTLGPLREPA